MISHFIFRYDAKVPVLGVLVDVVVVVGVTAGGVEVVLMEVTVEVGGGVLVLVVVVGSTVCGAVAVVMESTDTEGVVVPWLDACPEQGLIRENNNVS